MKYLSMSYFSFWSSFMFSMMTLFFQRIYLIVVIISWSVWPINLMCINIIVQYEYVIFTKELASDTLCMMTSIIYNKILMIRMTKCAKDPRSCSCNPNKVSHAHKLFSANVSIKIFLFTSYGDMGTSCQFPCCYWPICLHFCFLPTIYPLFCHTIHFCMNHPPHQLFPHVFLDFSY